MLAEGIGIKPPQKLQVRVTEQELRMVLLESERRAEFRGYRAKSDQWSNGLKPDLTVAGLGPIPRDVRPIFVGYLGEYAVSRWLSARISGKVHVDTRLRKAGDFGIDLAKFGLTMQIKTRQSLEPVSLVKRTSRAGGVLSIPSHAHCFCEWTGGSTIYLCGWIWSKDIASMPLVQSPVGAWMNAEVHDTQLLPMSSLVAELEAWRSAWR